MTLFDFKLLSEGNKLCRIYKEGIYIGKRRAFGTVRILYQMDSFYVELFYSKYRQYIRRIYCFTNINFLDPYLEQVDIPLWVNNHLLH